MSQAFGFNAKDKDALIRLIDHQPGAVDVAAPVLPGIKAVWLYTTGATARSGTTLGTGSGVVQTLSSGVFADWTKPAGGTLTIDYLNAAASSLSAGYVKVEREEISGKWTCIWDDCA